MNAKEGKPPAREPVTIYQAMSELDNYIDDDEFDVDEGWASLRASVLGVDDAETESDGDDADPPESPCCGGDRDYTFVASGRIAVRGSAPESRSRQRGVYTAACGTGNESFLRFFRRRPFMSRYALLIVVSVANVALMFISGVTITVTGISFLFLACTLTLLLTTVREDYRDTKRRIDDGIRSDEDFERTSFVVHGVVDTLEERRQAKFRVDRQKRRFLWDRGRDPSSSAQSRRSSFPGAFGAALIVALVALAAAAGITGPDASLHLQ